MYPYVAGKNFAFRILVEVAAFFWVVLISFNRRYKPENTPIALSVIAFTLIVGIANLTGVSPYISFWSNYERMEGYLTILHLTVYFLVISSVLRKSVDWKLFFNVVLGISFIVSLYSLMMQSAISVDSLFRMEYAGRIYGTLGNPPFLASYLLLTVFIGILAFNNTGSRVLKGIYISIILLHMVTILMTATRGAILAGIAGCFILLVLFFVSNLNRLKYTWKNIYKPLTVTIIFLIVVITFVLKSPYADHILKSKAISRFSNITASESVISRLNTWNLAWNGFKERPILGWGQENFIGVYSVNSIKFKEQQIWVDRAHNIVLEWLINAGIIGLFSYIAIFSVTFYVLWKKYRDNFLSANVFAVMITILIVYFMQNLFTFDTINTYFLFFALIAYIDNAGHGETKPSFERKHDVPTKKTRILSSFFILSLLVTLPLCMYFINYKPIKESKHYMMTSKSLSDYTSFPVLLRDLNNALSFKTFGDFEVKQGMLFISQNNIFRYKDFYADGALEFLKATVEGLEKELTVRYYDLEFLTKVINFYTELIFYNTAFIARTESLIENCLNLNPKYEWLYIALSDIYRAKKEYMKMFEMVKNIVNMDQDNDIKQMRLAVASILVKNEKTFMSAMKTVDQIRRNDERYAQSSTLLERNDLINIAEAYMEIKEFKKAVDFLAQVSDLTPGRAKVHYELSKAYLGLGDNVSALKEAKKAAEIDPNYVLSPLYVQ